MTGYSEAEILGKTPRLLQGPNTDRSIFKDLKKTLRNRDIFFGEAINYRKDGTEFWNQWHIEPIINDDGNLTHYIAIQRDVTAKKKAENELQYNASHDNLTGLYNRRWFLEQLNNCISKTNQEQDYVFALLFLDLDGFKSINDTLGHSVGDKFLQEVAKRLQKSLRHQDKLARLGGDEFTIIIDGVDDLQVISQITTKIQENLQYPFVVGGKELFTSSSIGITLSNLGYTTGEDMLRDADLAMYRAKSRGKSRSCIFSKTMHKVAVDRFRLVNFLHKALDKKELEVFYQPIIEVDNQKIVGFEALLRWNHPELGMISPAKFIPIAEETGLIVEIGEWVFRQVCLQSRMWLSSIPDFNFFINVNLSPRQLKQPDLVKRIDDILEQTNCDRNLIKLEITESGLLETSDQALKILSQLRDLGLKLCIDDFGTGYSSLSRLYQFPIETLKIDSCFVRAIGKNQRKEKILTTIVTLAENLGLNIVAEGIETEFQFEKIKELQCQYVQGYLFGKAMNSQDITRLIRQKYGVTQLRHNIKSA